MDYAPLIGAALGEKTLSEPVGTAQLAALAQRFPPDLVALWKTDGFAMYGDGLFWTVDPDDFAPLLQGWPQSPQNAEVIARDSFGNLFLRIGDEIYRLDVHRNVVDLIALTTEFFFDMKIYNPKFIDESLEGKRFKTAFKRLGPLAAGESYAFAPALALGGSGKADTLRKVSVKEHLALLAGLHE